ncbi:M48 family metalloprotease [Methylosinus sporium]|uniref:M48 family metalloprotease n=1 Tax=Methylosinus sporium TaxID=428 RepID=A0A549T6U9_METSR|nr:M48 family metalloprotease [Methylosinus sporium]TRL37599.1 M48 family metalloprotease [Methylosinus sporium]
MTIQQPVRRELDGSRLGHNGIFQAIGLLISAWIGVLVGAVLMAATGIGIIGTVGLLTSGIWAVPLFGFVFAAVGVSRARDSAIRQTSTDILPADHPLARTVITLASTLGLPAPLVGIYPDDDLNAFAAGSKPTKAVVSFSKGLTERMPPREIIAIAAHEVAHIANRDMRRMQFATSFQNALTWYFGWTNRGQMLARWLLSTGGELIVLRLSRKREYWADATAAALVGKDAMISALRTLNGDPVKPTAERLAYARLMIRANPRTWFSTHPSIADRITAIEKETYMRRLPYKTQQERPANRPAV